MGLIKYAISRVSDFDTERYKKHIDKIHENTGKSKLYIKLNWIINLVLYGTGYTDYFRGDFINLSHKQKLTFVTSKSFYKILGKLNSPDYKSFLRDKVKFNNMFKEFLKRDFIDIRSVDVKAFKDFLDNKEIVFAKDITSYGGHGVSKIVLKDYKDINELYNELLEKKQYLVEEAIIQCEELNEINPFSVASFRVITLMDDESKPHLLGNALRINQGKDNVVGSVSDLYFGLSEDGKIATNVIDDYGNIYKVHPLTKKVFEEVKIPFVKEAFNMCLKAATMLPEERYIGWDVAITKDGPLLIEGNEYPGYGIIQHFALKGSKTGHKKQIEDILGHKI